MRNENCRRYERAVYEESAIDEALRTHAATCPRCSALAAAAALSTPPVGTPSGDALARQLAALAAAAAVRHDDRRVRRRWLAPALIGASTYLFTICTWVVLLTQGPAAPGTAALPVPSAGLGSSVLPAPSPAAVGAVLVGSLLWITATVAVARRRAGVTA